MNFIVYDFDGTIYDGDSSIDFILFTLKKKKLIIKYLFKYIIIIFLFILKRKTKKEVKEELFSFLKEIDNIDILLNEFWIKNEKKIKKFYLQKKHDKDIIITASPTFIVEYAMSKYKIYDLMGTNMDKKTGKINGENCHDIEKVKRLYEKYPKAIVEEMYTDSYSDLPLLDIAKIKFIVKKNNIKEIR